METKQSPNGEMTLDLLGKKRTLRPTVRAIMTIERTLGMGLSVLLGERLVKKDFRLEDMATVFHHLLKVDDEKDRPTVDEIAEAIFQEGTAPFYVPYVQALTSISGAGPKEKPKGEAKAQTA